MDIHTSSPHPSFSEQPTSEHQSVKTPQVQAIIPLLLRIGPFPPNPNVLSTIHRYSESRHPAVSRPAKPRDPRPPVRGKALSLALSSPGDDSRAVSQHHQLDATATSHAQRAKSR
ncbi:hypothetical protein FSOLCH5_010212 [Fusarium solani]